MKRTSTLFFTMILSLSLLSGCSADNGSIRTPEKVLKHIEQVVSEDSTSIHQLWSDEFMQDYKDFRDKADSQTPAHFDYYTNTVEGDPIYYHLDYNGEDFYLCSDNTADRFRGADYYEYPNYRYLIENLDTRPDGAEMIDVYLSNIENPSRETETSGECYQLFAYSPE